MHTPTPWTTRREHVVSGKVGIYGPPREDGSQYAPIAQLGWMNDDVDNGAFIVRAVNSHEALKEALRRLVSIRHTHKAGENNIDACAACGLDIRDAIHYRVGEDQRTDLQFAREALKLAEG